MLDAAATAQAKPTQADHARTATPIQHLVVIFGENVYFDHYFASYPQAANDAAQAAFTQSMLDAQQTMINANN